MNNLGQQLPRFLVDTCRLNERKNTETFYYCASLVGSFPEETCEIHTDKCNWGLVSNHMHCFLLCFNQDLKYNGFAAKLLRMLIHSGHIDSGHQTKLGQCQIAYYHRLRCLSFCNVVYSFMIRVACFFKKSIYIWDMEQRIYISWTWPLNSSCVSRNVKKQRSSVSCYYSSEVQFLAITVLTSNHSLLGINKKTLFLILRPLTGNVLVLSFCSN